MITIYRFGHYVNTVSEDGLPEWLIRNTAWTLDTDEIKKALNNGLAPSTSTIIALGYTFTSSSTD